MHLSSVTIPPWTSSPLSSQFVAFHTYTSTHSQHLPRRYDIYNSHLLHLGVSFCFPWFILSVHEDAFVWCCWCWSYVQNACHEIQGKEGEKKKQPEELWNIYSLAQNSSFCFPLFHLLGYICLFLNEPMKSENQYIDSALVKRKYFLGFISSRSMQD